MFSSLNLGDVVVVVVGGVVGDDDDVTVRLNFMAVDSAYSRDAAALC